MQGVRVVEPHSAGHGATVIVSADLNHEQLVRLGPGQGPFLVMQHFLQKSFEDEENFEDAEEMPPDTLAVSSQ